MLAKFPRSIVQRRGVVLVVILGMLGLLALIGVTFATFSGQAKVNARNFSQAMNTPDTTEMMDFALSQLIDDTSNPQSAIRGHSLKRDMYGNDAVFNGLLNVIPSSGLPLTIQSFVQVTTATKVDNVNVTGTYKLVTNMSVNDASLYGYNFTRWILRLPPQVLAGTPATYYVGTTYEILVDDLGDTSKNRVFYVTPPDDSSLKPTIQNYATPENTAVGQSSLTSVTDLPGLTNQNFQLDGRFLHAFNGPGMEGAGAPRINSTVNGNTVNSGGNGAGAGLSRFANFRVNGNLLGYNWTASGFDTNADTPAYGDPNQICSMDEDYDACDLENWFLAIQSADGQVVVPSFHRPGILSYVNDMNNDWVNGSILSSAKILRPRAVDGHDATTFPNLFPDTTSGKINYDIDNDGDGITDSVWLDLGYPTKRNNEGQLYKPLFAFMVIGLNGRIPLNTAGNLQLRDAAGTPMFAHASHLGYSPSEIDPTFALQNAVGVGYQQYDNAMVPVSLTQLRNLLAGTRIPDGKVNNHENNFVAVNGGTVELPNNIADSADDNALSSSSAAISVASTAVPGRFGEPDKIPSQLPPPDINNFTSLLGTYTYYQQNASAILTPPFMMPYGPYTNPVRAGVSNYAPMNPALSPLLLTNPYGDVGDDNFNTFDPYPAVEDTTFTPPLMGSESKNGSFPADYYDAAGALSLPVERIRRFLTPIDVAGDGLVTKFNVLSGASTSATTAFAPIDFERAILGADSNGRVSYYKYFRPPGMPVATPAGASSTAPTPWYPTGTISPSVGNPGIPDVTNNLFHGYESFRNPANTGGRIFYAGSPSDHSTTPPSVPTFSNVVNSYGFPLSNFVATNPYYLPSSNLNEADELSLYAPSPNDMPYSSSDLAWLYRQQDSDGASLHSRLAQLAPISFLNPGDGLRRRRLFSTDSWELNNLVWAHDNPMNVFATNSRYGGGMDAGFAHLSLTPTTTNPLATTQAGLVNTNTVAINPVATPSLAHRDRKINLNYPLPVSNSVDEPVRQKWIRDTYQLLKFILPPQSTDTPQELAQLSQFVVNIIDYRDPDATMTKFVNTDVTVNPGVGGASGSAPTLVFSSTTPPVPYSPKLLESQGYLIQWGMEYNPVAINEVLAYQFMTKIKDGTDTASVAANTFNRMFVELVNTLTQDADATTATALDLAGWDFVIMQDDPVGRPDPNNGQIPFQSDSTPIQSTLLSTTPTGTANVASPIAPALTALTTASPAIVSYSVWGQTPMASPPTGALPKGALPSQQINGDFTEIGTPAITNQIDLITNSVIDPTKAAPTSLANKYYWLYLRRPPNPFDVTYNGTYPKPIDPAAPAAGPNDNRVVVDCFRFMLNASQCIGSAGSPDTVSPDPTTAGADNLYSLERLQPYRGGHAVPLIPATGVGTAAQFYCVPSYGYSEQTRGCNSTTSTLKGQFGRNSGGTALPSTDIGIAHTLGQINSTVDTNWDFAPIHDRDFASVAELLNVPGCPPGLFTKQFVEFSPPIPYTVLTPGNPTSTAGVPLQVPLTSAKGGPAKSDSAKIMFNQAPNPSPVYTFPYLVDNFFYTSESESVAWPSPGDSPAQNNGPAPVYPASNYPVTPIAPATVPTYVGGPGGAGWHKMLDFFEVPSPAFGSIGSVAQGSNYDWYRQDTRPGLLNLNLIIDEEVFFGLMSESWVSLINNPDATKMNSPILNQLGGTRLNVAQIQAIETPQVVTQVDGNGLPLNSYRMPNVGFAAADPNIIAKDNTAVAYPKNAYPNTYDNRMKAAFSDFLKLKHGGSGAIFAYGLGPVGTPWPAANPTVFQIAADRPFHSLSYPDINFTVMRPATLPPSVYTSPQAYPAPGVALPSFPNTSSTFPILSSWPLLPPPGSTTGTYFPVMDPGSKNPYYFTQNNPVHPEPIPPRRLFQLGDTYGTTSGFNTNASTPPPGSGSIANYQPAQPGTLAAAINPAYTWGTNLANPGGPWRNPASNAAASPAPIAGVTIYAGDPNVNMFVLNPNLTDIYADLALYAEGCGPFFNPTPSPTNVLPDRNPGGNPFPYLGCNGGSDRTQNPYFRNDWLQKVTNLTTVRTHQYAVWITVGFFEVLQQGDPMVGNSVPSLAYDKLGAELGILSGRNIRYRSFFILDRTKATGFSPQNPGNFRDCVVYRQAIE